MEKNRMDELAEDLGINLYEVNPFENEEADEVIHYTLSEIEGELNAKEDVKN